MRSLPYYLADCLNQKLLEPSPMEGVYWSSALAAKIARASSARRAYVTLNLGDFVVGSYKVLKGKRKAINKYYSDNWLETEVHHIVESAHLQFLGVVQLLDSQTRDHFEPCVLLATVHHKLHMENIIGVAQQMVFERRGVDFMSAFTTDHPGVSDRSLNEDARLRAAWVKAQETVPGSTINRREIRDSLLEMYSIAYQEPELRPLKLIANRVIRDIPL